MKKRGVLKKLVSSIMVATIVLGQFSGYHLVSKAATITAGDGPIYISLSKTNENGNGYAFDMTEQGSQGKHIWNLMANNLTKDRASANDSLEHASNFYCIKAEYGASWKNDPTNKAVYNKNYEVPLTQETESETANSVLLGEYKNELLWVMDNLYVQGESDESDFNRYLKNAGIIHDEDGYSYVTPTKYIGTERDYTSFVSTNAFEETIQEEDIIAIQQAVIWYFTNYEGENGVYDKKGKSPWIQYTNEDLLEDNTGTNKYPLLSSINQARGEHATILYNYLIDEARAVAEKLGNNEYKLKNSTIKLWLSIAEDGTANEEQPVIEVHKIEKKSFDLSLRKAIKSIKSGENNQEKQILNCNGEDATRNLNEDGSIKNVNTTTLNPTLAATLEQTTATYNHRKDPVVVEKGDIVTYAITIYNEGEHAGYANKIADQLPGTWSTGLRLQNNQTTIESTTGNIYNVEYITSTNTLIFTMAENSPKNVLNGYDQETDTLESETILVDCQVMGKPDTLTAKVLTNIAYIEEEYNEYFDIIISKENDIITDRDSQTWNSPQANSLVTADNGYTGNKNNITDLSKNDEYYAGEQDDDDFEKLIVLPKAFDIALRKNITKIIDTDKNEVEIENRTPSIDTTKLDNATEKTAEYKHRKDAVVVNQGDIVEYNISLYNEGSIAGIATIIKDQLPEGLKLNQDFFTKEGDSYYTISSKGNTYKVTYDEESNLVTFTIDKTKTAEKLLAAHMGGQKLDSDIITLQCIVDCKADSKQNTYLTNIAYIYEEEQEDGTIVTNQIEGADADRDSQPYTYPKNTAKELITIGNQGYTGNKNNITDLSKNDEYYAGEQDDDDFEKLVMLPKAFDLKLIKFITEVNGEATENRVLGVDTSNLNSTEEETTAEYKLEKNPVAVKAGDFITYTLRVYNEGDYDGYATEISENIPEGLEFIVVTDGALLSWDGTELKDITEELKKSEMYNKIIEINSNWGYKKDSTTITTEALKEDLIKAFGQKNVEYVDKENNIDYKEISVIFKVKEDVKENITIRNEAAISQDKAVDKNGEEIDALDRDSLPGNTEQEWKKENSNETYDEEGKWPIYEQDDEDYDNIITKAFDLSLRKQVIKVNDTLYTNRFAKLLEDSGEQENLKSLYSYYDVYNSKPKVKAGDKVTYSIKVYNEGDIDGYATLIVDALPEGLEFANYEVGDGSINDQYGWKLVEGTENLYQTDYLSYDKDTNKGTTKSTILRAYDGNGEASYQEIYIECIVKQDIKKEDSLLNVAQIAEDSDENGKPIKDKDSIPGTADNEENWKDEDDLDIEILELQEFDLALRKFITEIENGENIKKVDTRIPEVSYDQEKNQLVYTHTKNPLVVHVGETIIYTLRVYNEGDIDGYASEIKDDIPEYLEYLPDHKINEENEWVMYDSEGNKTEDIEKAVYIKTDHLAKGKGVEAEKDSKETNLIKAFNPNDEVNSTNPDYKEIKVAFKVKDPNSTEYEIINFAQISDDSDSKGDPIKDKDSTPDNGENVPKEDDEDIEKVKVEYFDLSLLKYVTKVIVNENGQERIIETGNIGDENDIIPHVQINKKNIDKTIVKFIYTIQITNEGQIAGEATEITDYVPEGLVFVEEDNELWTDEGNNVISTKQLEGTRLEPGDTAQVEVTLRWINGKDNLGPKTNVAEISEDYNEENVPDIDSTPDNRKEGEDDIDEATVLLSVNQGGGIQKIYINLIVIFLGIILVGAILIKKFVL